MLKNKYQVILLEVDENFNEVLKDQRVMPHLHLSIQSGDNMILKRMKRRHNSKDVFQFVDRYVNNVDFLYKKKLYV